MTTVTQKTSIIAISALFVTLGLPSAFASAGTVENTYWQQDPRMCYLSTELDTLDFEGDTSNNSAAIEGELDQSVSIYNTHMDDADLLADSGTCPQQSINVGKADLGWWGTIAATTLYAYSNDDTRALYADIDFSSQQGFGDDSNTCNSGDIDIEWIMNHELGHAVGLNHHWHFTPDSTMHNYCDGEYDTLQSVDQTALDIKY